MSSQKRFFETMWSFSQQNEADIAHFSSSSISNYSSSTTSFTNIRLPCTRDSIELKKQKTQHVSEDIEMDTVQDSNNEHQPTRPPSTFPHNDSMEMFCPGFREEKQSSAKEDDHTEDLLNKTNLRICFDSSTSLTTDLLNSSAEYKTKLARWPAMVNLNSDVELSDAQFLNGLIPLLQQIPSERKTSVRDRLCRILLHEISVSETAVSSFSTSNHLEQMISLFPEEKINTMVITPSTAALQTFMKDAQELLLHPGKENCYTQSTPILIKSRKVSPLSGHFPLASSLSWNSSEFDF